MSAFEQTGSVPSRRRSKSPKPEPRDPVEQFGGCCGNPRSVNGLHKIAFDWSGSGHAIRPPARLRKLVDAIRDVREACRAGSGVAAADEAWRQAKARLIELVTGGPPSGRVTTSPTHRRATTAPTLPRRSLGSSVRSRSTQRCRSALGDGSSSTGSVWTFGALRASVGRLLGAGKARRCRDTPPVANGRSQFSGPFRARSLVRTRRISGAVQRACCHP